MAGVDRCRGHHLRDHQRLPGHSHQLPWSTQRSDALGRCRRARAQLGVPHRGVDCVFDHRCAHVADRPVGLGPGIRPGRAKGPRFLPGHAAANQVAPLAHGRSLHARHLGLGDQLSSFVQVLPGMGIWGMAVLMALLGLIANRDMRRLWELNTPLQSNEVRS